MSKRTRGSARAQHRRPGRRPPTSRSAGTRLSGAPSPAQPLDFEPTDDALDSLPRVERAAIADPPAATNGPTANAVAAETRRSSPGTHGRTRVKPGSLLATRAANEYVYVAQDLKRISVLAGALFGILLALWLLIVVLRVIPLPFY